MDIEKIEIKNNSVFEIHWYMTEWCNYKCEYCKYSKESHKWIPYEQIIEAAKKINRIIENLDFPVTLFLVGGEVTYYDLVDLLTNYLTAKNLVNFRMITNLSQSVDYFTRLKEVCDDRNISLAIRGSVHLTQINNINYFIEKLRVLDYVKLNLVLTNDNYKQTKDFLEIMIKNNLKNKVDLILDKYTTEFSAEVMKVYEEYSYSDELEKLYKYIVTTTDGASKLATRAEVLVNNYDFRNYNCSGLLRIYTSGKVTSGACHSHNKLPIDLDKLQLMNKSDLENYITVVCEQKKCPVCTFSKIWRD